MVYYRTIWDTGKNFGGFINHEMGLIPNSDDWVVWMDGDVMFLTDFFGKQIEDIIAEHGSKYALFGAKTNRLGGVVSADQLLGGICSEDADITSHIAAANILHNNPDMRTLVVETKRPIAASCMFFRKSTWEKVKFIPNSPHFDTNFSYYVRDKVGPLAVCEGLYVFHKYRWGKKDPAYQYEHLL